MAPIAPASALAFAGAVCTAIQAVTIKYGSAKARETTTASPAFTAAFTTIVVSVGIFWTLLLAQGVPRGVFSLANAGPFVVAGILNPAVFRLLYFKGIDEVGAPVAAALMAMNPLVATVFAVPVLGETVTAATGLGMLCIVGGGVIIQSVQNAAGERENGGEGSGDLDLVARHVAAADTRSLLAPVVAMAVFGISYVVIKFGLNRFPDPVAGTAVAQTTALAAFLCIFLWSPGARRQVRSVNRPALGLFVVAGVVTASAQLANFFALDLGSAVTVIPLFNTFPLLVLVLTYAIAREVPRSATVLVGVLAIVGGSVLIEVF
ncbi:hypothetical protein C2R22_21575 (plasmid) [Salinigranum rubrum]|uniref:EamA domain-containing protein n=1 Tax=Salinigranum rubrum TaxID=755307 RepID=A0A2I8VQJ3_9EURY|nr:DMT family transporter [Salinigranum rubrum]AUV84166.1 hypothetical protein C2R22_21575 [Salinigranum rubrum]